MPWRIRPSPRLDSGSEGRDQKTNVIDERLRSAYDREPKDRPMNQPPLKFLHAESTLIPLKLARLERLATEVIKMSLLPGQEHCLKARADGTMLDGHHRIYILRKRGVD